MRKMNFAAAPRILAASAMIVAAFACVKEESVRPTEAPEPGQVEQSILVPGEAKVQLSDGMAAMIEEALENGLFRDEAAKTKSPSLNQVLGDLGIESMERIFPHAGKFEGRTRRAGLHRFYKVKYREDIPHTKADADLAGVPGVLSVTPVRKIKLRGWNDPQFSNQWHYVNTYKSGADINVQEVWDNYTVGSSNVIVSVCDEGVYMAHEDLSVVPAGEGGSKDFVDNDYSIETSDGHGTHVAGTVAAISNNGKGVAGIAGGNYAAGIAGARILSTQIFDKRGYSTDEAGAQAMKYSADAGAVILQCSWGYYADANEDGTVSSSELRDFKSITIDPAEKAAIDYFLEYAGCDDDGNQLPDSPMKGGIVFFAAGNENIDYDPICDYEPVIAVGAFGRSGSKASYSNYGDWVDLGAPGGDGSYPIYSTLPNNKYGGSGWMGTSMACPHASGVAALIVSYFGGEGFTAENCREYILEGAVENYFSSTRPIGKKLDALGAFEYGAAHSSSVRVTFSGASTIHEHETATVNINVLCPGDNYTLSLESSVQGVTLGGNLQDGYFLSIAGKEAGEGLHSATVTAKYGTEQGKGTFTFTILPNHSPFILKGIDDTLLGDSPLTFNLSGYFDDEDGEELSFAATTDDGSPASVSVSGNTLTVSRRAIGRGVITVTATDGVGASASMNVTVVAKDADAPIDIYPTSVTTSANITNDSPSLAKTKVVLVGSSGSTVYETENFASAFTPISIPMTGMAPGVYYVKVTYRGKTYRKAFVKI